MRAERAQEWGTGWPGSVRQGATEVGGGVNMVGRGGGEMRERGECGGRGNGVGTGRVWTGFWPLTAVPLQCPGPPGSPIELKVLFREDVVDLVTEVSGSRRSFIHGLP